MRSFAKVSNLDVPAKVRYALFFLFRRTIEKNLFLEYRDAKLSRAIGDTDDLSVFPDLSAEDIAAIRQLLGVALTGAGAIAAGGSASLMN